MMAELLTMNQDLGLLEELCLKDGDNPRQQPFHNI
jgi:hypothetical protein